MPDNVLEQFPQSVPESFPQQPAFEKSPSSTVLEKPSEELVPDPHALKATRSQLEELQRETNLSESNQAAVLKNSEFDDSMRHGSPEFNFLLHGDAFKLLRKDPLKALAIGYALLRGQARDFTKDSEQLAQKVEAATIQGVEHIPAEQKPIILACNHPDLYDLGTAVIHITAAFQKARQEKGLPSNVHWLVANEIPPREARGKKGFRAFYNAIDWGIGRLHQVYNNNFIPVPVTQHGENAHEFARGRAKALLAARAVLQDTSGSQVIGMFPEGDITSGEGIDAFQKGIGALARSAGTDVAILPTYVGRDAEDTLRINFGESFSASKKDSAEEITEHVREAVRVMQEAS